VGRVVEGGGKGAGLSQTQKRDTGVAFSYLGCGEPELFSLPHPFRSDTGVRVERVGERKVLGSVGVQSVLEGAEEANVCRRLRKWQKCSMSCFSSLYESGTKTQGGAGWVKMGVFLYPPHTSLLRFNAMGGL